MINVVPNSNPVGIKRFVLGTSISRKCHGMPHYNATVQYKKILTPGDLNWVQH